MRSRWISLLSIGLAAAIVYGIYVLQLRQVEVESTVPVLAPRAYIQPGTWISEDLLEWRPMVKAAVTEQMVMELEQVIGMENVVALGESEPILLWKLDKLRLMPTAHQATFQIPRSYVLSISSEIRAGDAAALYVSGAEGSSRRLFDHSVMVASVKTSSGAEVDDDAGSNLRSRISGDQERLYAARRESGGLIDHINLNLTEEEWLMIDQLCKDGANKLVIAFTGDVSPGRLP